MASASRQRHNAQFNLAYSIASSNETADNLPGVGRIIGNCYTFTGRGLERWLNRTAERLGYGPKAVAVRIQRRRKAITTYPDLPLLPGPFRAETRKIEEDCRRLIGYIRSNVASTKKQALDRIIDLSIDDSYIRGLFNVLGAVDAIEPLQRDPGLWIYYGSSLQNSSWKALVSLKDVEINMALRTVDVRISAFKNEVADWEGPVMYGTLRKLFTYMHDPDRSFIAVRYYRRLFENSDVLLCFDIAVEKALDLIRNPPNDFEWEEGDRLLACLLEWIRIYNSSDVEFPENVYQLDLIEHFLAIVEITLRHADKLTRTANSKFFQMWLLHFDGDNVADNFLNAHYYMYLFIQNVGQNMNEDGSWKVGTSRYYVYHNIDLDTNNLHSNASYLQTTYPHIHSHFLLRRAICPPDLVMCEIARKWRGRIFPYFAVVLQPTELETPCLEIARYVDSNDAVVRKRALRCASVLLHTDVYCRAAMMRAFASTRFTATLDFAEMIKNTRSLCKSPLYRDDDRIFKFGRIRDANGNLLHVEEHSTYTFCNESLEMNSYDMLELRVPRGTAFSSAGHYPLLAGYTAGSKPAYVARACFTDTTWKYCTITEGDRPEDLRVPKFYPSETPLFEPFFVDVFVLRYAPAVYAESGCNDKIRDGGEGLDATGPFFWEPVSESAYYYRARNEGFWDEGVPGGEFSSEIEDWTTDKYDSDNGDYTMDICESDDGDCSMEGSDFESGNEDRAMEGSKSDGEDWKTAEEGSIITLG